MLKLESITERVHKLMTVQTGTVIPVECLVREVIAACGLEVANDGEVYSPAPKQTPSLVPMRTTQVRSRYRR